jgi:formylglycine-generating enzyme required for sulfatase activity
VDRLRKRLLDIMEGNRLPAIERAQAGNNLAALGDPRFNVDLWHLPADETLGFVRIPAGKFLMGSDDKDKQARDNEKPQHEVELPEYWMAKYPVTVAQYRSFVEISGYETSVDDALYGNLNHPVVNVTWYDALEYTKWLDEKMRKIARDKLGVSENYPFWQGLAEGKLRVTLSSEAEWEKAARGTDGRLYSWKNEFDIEKANIYVTAIAPTATSSVGCFPSWRHGLYDMSVNVWEWTRSISSIMEDSGIKDFTYPYKSNDGREDLSRLNEKIHVTRGSDFASQHNYAYARCAFRDGFKPNFRVGFLGFRVVVSPVLPSRL